MNTAAKARRARLALTATLALLTGAALAQSSGGEFTVKQTVIAGGSATASGGEFSSSATAGQHDADTASGGTFRVQGGFWPASASAPDGPHIFGDGFEG